MSRSSRAFAPVVGSVGENGEGNARRLSQFLPSLLRPALGPGSLDRKYQEPAPQGWRTFLRNHAQDIVAIDLFVVPPNGFKILFGLVILEQRRRRIIRTSAT